MKKSKYEGIEGKEQCNIYEQIYKEVQKETLLNFITWDNGLSDEEHDKIGFGDGIINESIQTYPHLAHYIKEVLKLKVNYLKKLKDEG